MWCYHQHGLDQKAKLFASVKLNGSAHTDKDSCFCGGPYPPLNIRILFGNGRV